MRLGVLILRKNYYRLLGPVVEEALCRGYDVECWHDWSGPRRGAKSSEFPDTVPVFAAGAPRVTGYGGTADLAERWRRDPRSEEHTSEIQSLRHLVCRLLLEKKK